MLNNLFFKKISLNAKKLPTRFLVLSFLIVFLNGCLVQPVLEEANLAPETNLDIAEQTEAELPETDTWQRIRNGFDLPDVQDKRVQQELNWFKRHPEYIKRVVERARPYLHYIIETVDNPAFQENSGYFSILK